MKKRNLFNRREFLEASVGVGPVLLTHLNIRPVSAGPASPASEKMRPRILELDLATAAPLAEMRDFYHGKLGFELIESGSDYLRFRAGLSELTFRSSGSEKGAPFYHFAFNIPENKIVEALHWQMERTPIIPVPETLRDGKYSPEIVNYSHWNAHSVFFFDPAQNVVEYIARHDLKNARRGAFETGDILYASEIGFVVDDVALAAKQVAEAVGCAFYRGTSDVFTPVGDEHGLLLIMKRGRSLSLASPQKKEASVFKTRAVVQGLRSAEQSFPGFPYDIEIKAA